MGQTINSMVNNNLQMNMLRLGTAQKINSASDDAAGLAIAEKLHAQIDGLEQGTRNTEDMNNAVKTAEGGLSTISDGLQRLNELSVQAANGINSADEIAIYQNEANEILKGISDTVGSTQFNNKNLLDGSFTNMQTASDANANGMKVSIGDMSLEALGLDEFNISDPTAMASIESAMNTVNSQRSALGAVSNTFAHTIGSNDITSLNMAAAKSRIADADMAKEASEAQKNQMLQQYNLAMQKQEMDRTRTVNPISAML